MKGKTKILKHNISLQYLGVLQTFLNRAQNLINIMKKMRNCSTLLLKTSHQNIILEKQKRELE